jgi:hypothetical protein
VPEQTCKRAWTNPPAAAAGPVLSSLEPAKLPAERLCQPTLVPTAVGRPARAGPVRQM